MTGIATGWSVAWLVVVSRRFLCWAVLALVLVAGGALGQAQRAASSEVGAPVASASPVHLSDVGDEGGPCVVRADCAGAGLFVGMGLLLVVAVAVPTVGAVAPVGRVRSAPRVLRSTLAGQRLFRPPQLSS